LPKCLRKALRAAPDYRSNVQPRATAAKKKQHLEARDYYSKAFRASRLIKQVAKRLVLSRRFPTALDDEDVALASL
jgi:Tfp pilus assembly protein PilF